MKKILIIEDNKDLVEVYKEMLSHKGYSVTVCTDGMNAVSVAHEVQADLILLDIMMPLVSGYDFLRAIEKKGIRSKVVINTSLDKKDDLPALKKMGVVAILRKSDFTPSELCKKIATFL